MLYPKDELKVEHSLSPQEITTNTDTDGAAVQRDVPPSLAPAMITVYAGAITDGDYVIKVQERDGSDSFTDVAADDLDGSFTDLDNTDDDSVQKVGYLGGKDDIRVRITSTNVTSGGFFAAWVTKATLRDSDDA